MKSKTKQTYSNDKRDNDFQKELEENKHKEKNFTQHMKESETPLANIDKNFDFQKLKNTKLFKKFLKEQEADTKKKSKPMNTNKDDKKAPHLEKKLNVSKPIPSFNNTFNLSEESDMQSAKMAFGKINQAKEQLKYNESALSFKKSQSPKQFLSRNDEYSIESQEEIYPQFGRTNTNDSQAVKKQSNLVFNPSEELQGYSEIIPGLILKS